MAQWQRTLDLTSVWNTEDLQKIAAHIAGGLKNMVPFGDEEIDYQREDIAGSFEALAEDTEATARDFDYVMEELYDWADSPLDERWNGKKVCWVKTF